MLRQSLHEWSIQTKGRGFYELTDDVVALVRRSGFQTGLLTLHVQHTSASLLIQENADPEVRRDLERFFARLAPDGDPLFRHTAEGDDDMPAGNLAGHLSLGASRASARPPRPRARVGGIDWQIHGASTKVRRRAIGKTVTTREFGHYGYCHQEHGPLCWP